jgi:hypothetical protein
MAEDTPISETLRTLNAIRASAFKPVYEPLDLGKISPEFSGQTLQVLRNPSRLFRRTFLELRMSNNEFAEWVGYIFNMTTEQATEWLDNADQGLYVFLFSPVYIDATETEPARVEQRYVIQLWDQYATDCAKKYHAPSSR